MILSGANLSSSCGTAAYCGLVTYWIDGERRVSPSAYNEEA